MTEARVVELCKELKLKAYPASPATPLSIPAERAREHVGSCCTVEMTVKSSKHEPDKHIYYLDSEEDYLNANNLAVVIAETDLEQFRANGIQNPAQHYQNKTIRVTGDVVFNDEQFQICVANPSNIEVVNPNE